MAKLSEKIGYGMGDMSSSMFWKIFSYYLPIFYSDIFGLSLAQTASLMFVTRVWDTVSDPMMGVIADRTVTRWGKYRPYLLWFAAPFAVAGILLFTTPDVGNQVDNQGRLMYAYITYILMMTVYTCINVPYASMLGVVTSDSQEKTVFSSYRMFFAYGGSFIALFAWEPLCDFFTKYQPLAKVESDADAWQGAMIVIATLCFLLFIGSFMLTREHVKVKPALATTSSICCATSPGGSSRLEHSAPTSSTPSAEPPSPTTLNITSGKTPTSTSAPSSSSSLQDSSWPSAKSATCWASSAPSP